MSLFFFLLSLVVSIHPSNSPTTTTCELRCEFMRNFHRVLTTVLLLICASLWVENNRHSLSRKIVKWNRFNDHRTTQPTFNSTNTQQCFCECRPITIIIVGDKWDLIVNYAQTLKLPKTTKNESHSQKKENKKHNLDDRRFNITKINLSTFL